MFKITPICASDLVKIVNGKLYGDNCEINYISLDTRENFYGNTVYIAIKGEKFDGNVFIDEAIRKGCNLVISNVIKNNVPTIVVDDTALAFGLIAKCFSNKTTKIAITGSVGKTTVKEMVSLVLKEKYNVYKTNKNENNEIGVPTTLLNGIDSDYCVIEMGMRGLGQIKYLSYLCEPKISIVTNVGSAHLEILKTKENIFKAKTEILEHTKDIAIIPYDKRFLSLDYRNIKPIFIGDNVKINDYKYTATGIKFSCKYFDEIIDGFSISNFNFNNVTNALFAITVGKICNVHNDLIIKGIKKYKCENMHGEELKINEISMIIDCYNASYESVKSSLFSLKKQAEIEKKTPYLLLGDMLEIGEKSSEYHYRIGELAKDLGIKNIYAVGKYAKHTLDGFLGGVLINDNIKLATEIKKNLGKNDIILIKGSREMKLEKIVELIKNND